MSLTSFHAGHESHSLVKAFLQLSYQARKRFVEMTRSAIKREVLEEPQPVQRTSSRYRQSTTELPDRGSSQRAMSVISITSQVAEPQPQPDRFDDTTIPDGDAEMTNGESTGNGITNGLSNGSHATNGAHATEEARASSAPTLNGEEDGDLDSLVQDSLPLFELSQHLERLGIANTLPSLPKATLVGDQNHGKSSVGEALSGISFPREEGTCTRAPFEVTVSPAQPGVEWEADIQLLIKYDYTPKTKAQNGYPGWTERQVPWTIAIRTALRDKEQAARILQDAQLAILNPPYEPFSGGNCPRPTGHGVAFTPNVIQVHVKRRTMLSLSFIDLPGLVHRLSDAEQYLVGLLEKLVKNYVDQPNALILLAHQSDTDLSTTQAYDLVYKAGAQSRCIGILTKPDKSEDSNARMAIVHDLLRGKTTLGGKNSWFVTKQLSSNDVQAGVTHAEARAMEQEFFSRSPWADKWAEYGSRFGTPNLARAISIRLRDHIQMQLPDMLARVHARCAEVEAKLQGFPKPSDSPTRTVSQAIKSLARFVTKAIGGDGVGTAFRKQYKLDLEHLRKQLLANYPLPELKTPGYVRPPISIDSDEEEQPSPPKKGRGLNGQVNSTPSARRTATPFETPRKMSFKPDRSETARSATRDSFTLDEVREMMNDFAGFGVQVEIDPRVSDCLIEKSQQRWPDMIDKFLRGLEQLLHQTLETCVEEALPSDSLLRRTIRSRLWEVVNELLCKQVDEVHHLLRLEMKSPTTLQENDLKAKTASNKETLRRQRLVERLNEHFDTLASEATSKQEASKIPKAPDARMARRSELEPDMYDREVEAMAQPIAYYKLAATRLADNIGMRLRHELLTPMQDDVLAELYDRIDTRDAEACAALLVEDEDRERERQALLLEREHLLEAARSLEQARGAGYQGTPRV